MKQAHEAVLADPTWFPDGLDTNGDQVGFARVSAESLAAEAFLDQRMASSVTERRSLPLSDLLAAAQKYSNGSPAYIFHSAFCCSTLLARALDRRGTALSLKEPNILMALANVLRVNDAVKASPEQARRHADLVTDLLSRRFTAEEQIILKPTNTANNLLPLAIESGAKVLLLHSDLRSFLISVLKKGEACKAFVRQQFTIFALDEYGLGAIPQRQAMGFTDLQVAAVVWRHQMELFSRALRANPEQVASLDAQKLMANPAQALIDVAAHFNLRMDEAHLRSVATGPIFSRNSKFSEQQYNTEQRKRESQEIEQRYSDVLDMMVQWAGNLSLGTTVEWPLPNAL